MKIKLVIFDLDGTIADTIPDIAAAMRWTILKYGDFGDLTELTRRSIGNGSRKMLERILKGLNVEPVDFEDDLRRYLDYYAAHSCIYTKLYPDTLPVFDGLEERGIKMAVATMKPRNATMNILESFGLDKRLIKVVSSDDMEEPKPSPRSLYACANEIGALPEECVVVGDSMTDVGCAINGGAVSVALMGGYYDQEKMKNSGAMFSTYELKDVLDIVDSFEG